jgi:hypothetical protein
VRITSATEIKMQVLVASLMLLAAAEAAVAQCPLSSPAAGLGAMTPACHLGQGQDQLTLIIRVSHADCNPASGTKVTVVASRDKSCRGVTSTDGYYVTSVQKPEVNKWSHVTIVGQGQGEKGALTVSMSRDVSSGNPQVQAVYADHTMSVVDTTCSDGASSSSNCTAVISLVLETGVKAGSKGQGHGVEKRAWDDDSMNWLKRGGRWGEDMMWIKRADDDQAMTDDASNNKVKAVLFCINLLAHYNYKSCVNCCLLCTIYCL